MRPITLFLLTFSLISPAMAQLQPINPPVNPAPSAAAAGQPGARKLTPDGKIQIGYDKRSDYRLIKQPTGNPPPAAPTNTAPRSPNGSQESLDGDIFSPAAAPQPPLASPAVAAAPPAPAATAKPRSDSALRSDSTPAREAAAASQAAAAAKAAEDKKKADALAAAIAAAQKAGALPLKPQ